MSSNISHHVALQELQKTLKADPGYVSNPAVLSHYGWRHKEGGHILCVSSENSGYSALQLAVLSTVGRVLDGGAEVEGLGNWRPSYDRMESAKFVVMLEKPDGTTFSADWEVGITHGTKMQDAITDSKINRNWLKQDRSGALMRLTQHVFEKKAPDSAEGYNPAAWRVPNEVQGRFTEVCEVHHIRPVRVYDVHGLLVHPHNMKAALNRSIVKVSYLLKHIHMKKQAYDSFTGHIHRIDILVPGAPDQIAGPQQVLAPAFNNYGGNAAYARANAVNSPNNAPGGYTPNANNNGALGNNGAGYANNSSSGLYSANTNNGGAPPSNFYDTASNGPPNNAYGAGQGGPHGNQSPLMNTGYYGAPHDNPTIGGGYSAPSSTYVAPAAYAPYNSQGDIDPNATSAAVAPGAVQRQDEGGIGGSSGGRVPANGATRGDQDGGVRKMMSPTPRLSSPRPPSTPPRQTYGQSRPPSTPPRGPGFGNGGYPFTPPNSHGWVPHGSPYTPHGFYNGVPANPSPGHTAHMQGNWPFGPSSGRLTPQMRGDWPQGPPNAWLTANSTDLADAPYHFVPGGVHGPHSGGSGGGGYGGPSDGGGFPGVLGDRRGGTPKPPPTQPILHVGEVLPIVAYGDKAEVLPYRRPGKEGGSTEPDVRKSQVANVATSSSLGGALAVAQPPPTTPATQKGSADAAGSVKSLAQLPNKAASASATNKRVHEGEERTGDDNVKRAKTVVA